MEQIPDNIEEVLQRSIQLEQDGYKYYSESSKRLTNSVGKRMLERLASDEKNHIRRFTEMYEAVTNNKVNDIALENIEPTSFEQLFNRLKGQLDGAIDDLGTVGVDDAEILEMALDLESHTKFFYKEAAKKSDDQKIKSFYEALAQEEQAHYDVLRKALEFLEDPSLFFGMGGGH